MKSFIKLSLLFILNFFACTKSSDTNKNPASLIGKWKLTETLTDPGDGSGTFINTTIYAYIVFKNDSSLEKSNLYSANISFESVRYSLPNDSVIVFIDSSGMNVLMYYKYKIDVDTLTIMGGCYEACGSKYIKQD